MSVHPQTKRIASGIKYEWNMFRYCYNNISSEEADEDRKKHDLLLEGLLLHARVLRDFFTKKPKKDDVSAIHFFDDPAVWENIKDTLCPYLWKHRERINKYLAHLTYDRLRKDKMWNCGAIFGELEHAWQQFYSLLPQKRKAWFK